MATETALEIPKGGARLRARPSFYVDPLTGCMVYSIEDDRGRTLRRVNNARSGQDALLRYWRNLGLQAARAVLAETGQHMGAAMAARRSTPNGRTLELPFEAPGPAPGAKRAARASKRQPVQPGPLQQDLFTVTEAASPIAPEPVEVVPERPHRLDPATLQRVDYRTVGPADRPDAYLYHVAAGTDAQAALHEGLAVNPADPLILTERPGVPYWLSVMAEDDESGADIAVLRMRRIAVDGMLEADPDATSSAGCACWLLTGGET